MKRGYNEGSVSQESKILVGTLHYFAEAHTITMEPTPTTPSSPPQKPSLPQMTGWLPRKHEDGDYTDLKPVAPRNKRPRKWKMPLMLLTAVILGAAVGSLMTRQRYKAQQVVASVNGHVIHEADFLHNLEVAQGDAVLKKMVADELQLQYARKLGVYPTDAEVTAKYKTLSEQPNFGQYLASTHQSPEDIVHSIRVVLAQAALVNKGNTVSEADVRAYYARQSDKSNIPAKFYTPPSVTISVIVSSSEQTLRKAEKELASGSSFAGVAAKYSEDNSKNNGGVLPPILKGRSPSSRIPGVEDAVFSLQVGEQFGPKQLAGNWWIIRCLDKKPAALKPFEEVKAECREGALLQKSLSTTSRQVHDDYAKFEKQASFQAFWPQYKYILGAR